MKLGAGDFAWLRWKVQFSPIMAAFLCLWMPQFAQAQDLNGNGSFVTVINPSFEDNQVSDDIYTTPGYSTTQSTINPQTGIAGWQFNASGNDSDSGIVTETGTIFGSPKYIPEGWQAAFIQGTGWFSQTVTFSAKGTYVIRFRSEGRNTGGVGAEPVMGSVDGNNVGTFTPFKSQWTLFTSIPFTVAAGVHDVSFAGTIPLSQSDCTSFVDAVQIVTLTEAGAVTPPTSPVYDIVFVGDSITAGATLSYPATEASAVTCRQSLGRRYNALCACQIRDTMALPRWTGFPRQIRHPIFIRPLLPRLCWSQTNLDNWCSQSCWVQMIVPKAGRLDRRFHPAITC